VFTCRTPPTGAPEQEPADPFLAADPFAASAAPAPVPTPLEEAPAEAVQAEEPTWQSEEYKEVTVEGVQRSGSERKSFRLTLKVEGEDKVLCMRIGDAEGSALVSFMRDADVSRCASHPLWPLTARRGVRRLPRPTAVLAAHCEHDERRAACRVPLRDLAISVCIVPNDAAPWSAEQSCLFLR
jgi:hypothetical protein